MISRYYFEIENFYNHSKFLLLDNLTTLKKIETFLLTRDGSGILSLFLRKELDLPVGRQV